MPGENRGSQVNVYLPDNSKSKEVIQIKYPEGFIEYLQANGSRVVEDKGGTCKVAFPSESNNPIDFVLECIRRLERMVVTAP